MSSSSALLTQEWRPGGLPRRSRDPNVLRMQAGMCRDLANSCLTEAAQQALCETAATLDCEARKLEAI